MAKILTFQNKDGTPSGETFLTDANLTLTFRTTKDGGTSLGDISHPSLSGLFPDPKKDWSNQELADLFRVRQLLSSANVPVETDRGVTDEGDPWFIFCHAHGEVFIHLCRIDGAYILDSPNILRPLRGANFQDLIADFSNHALPTSGNDDDPEHRVIRFERGGKVRLHPSAMLAALIWTLFLASEELVLLAPEEAEAKSDALLDFDSMFSVSAPNTVAVDQILDENDLELSHMVKDSETNLNQDAFELQALMRDTQQHQQQGLTLHNNAFTMGLSTIAIAMGFMSETILLNNQLKVLRGLEALELSRSQIEDGEIEHIQISADENSDHLIEILADFLGLELSRPDDNVASLKLGDADASGLRQDLGSSEKSIIINQSLLIATKNGVKPIVSKRSDVDILEAEPDNTPEQLLNLQETASTDINFTNTDDSKTSALLSSIMAAHQVELQKIQIADGTIWLESSATMQEAFDLFIWADVQTTPSEKERELGDFEEIAQRMMNFLENKTANIGMIELSSGTGIIFIDRLAVGMGEVDYMHWEANDGKIISLIGFASDLEQFDMIA